MEDCRGAQRYRHDRDDGRAQDGGDPVLVAEAAQPRDEVDQADLGAQPAADSMIRNSEIAVKKAPATGLVKCLVITTVTARVVTAATAAPTRFSAPPRATSFSRGDPLAGRSPAGPGQRPGVWRRGRRHEPGPPVSAGRGSRAFPREPLCAWPLACCRLALGRSARAWRRRTWRMPSGAPVAV